MRLTLLESDRSFLRSAECAFVSILAHAGVVWLAVVTTDGGRHIPTDEREASPDQSHPAHLDGAPVASLAQ